MLSFEVNENESNERVFEPIPEGKYQAYVTKVTCKKTSTDVTTIDKAQISVEYTMHSEHAGRKAWFNSTLKADSSEGAKNFVTKQGLKMAGLAKWQCSEENFLEEVCSLFESAQGNLVEIDIKHEQNYKDPTKTDAKPYANKIVIPF